MSLKVPFLYCNLMRPIHSDDTYVIITLPVITLSGFHCIFYYLHLQMFSKAPFTFFSTYKNTKRIKSEIEGISSKMCVRGPLYVNS